MERIKPRRLLFSGALLLLAVVLAATATAAARSARTGQTGRAQWVPATAAPLVFAVRYQFEGTARTAWSDSSGNGHHLTPLTGNGAQVSRARRGAGRAVQFPPPCRRVACPRLVLRARSAPALNPATRPFRYGAALRLAPNRTTRGQNVLQKGYSTEGSQYKLQVDGRSGHPSCAIVAGAAIHLALARVTVADDRWHSVECRRAGTVLAVSVDGTRQGTATLPASLSIENNRPLSLGGKSAYGDNDQFHGQLDDVWVAYG